jgi:hypothetical protein
MSKVFLLSLSFIIGTVRATPAHAIMISLLKPTGASAFNQFFDSQAVGRNVLDLSLSAFHMASQQGLVTYEADAKNINKINGTAPSKIQFSLSEVRVYGWCFSFNGGNTNDDAVDVKTTGAMDEIVWYYGYMSQVSGEWRVGCFVDSPDLQSALTQLRSRHL